ncbi:MAG: heat-inducible transcriptional repressor HrcA [Acidobacteriota bacterium]
MTVDDLSERQHEILCEVVQVYLEQGEPVASSAVVQLLPTALSSASIRTVMAELEQKGYLLQPHPSAGRVPSDKGLSCFIQGLARRAVLASVERRRLRAMISGGAPLPELLEQTSRVLARVTDEVGMALAPAHQAPLESIHFFSAAPGRVVAVLVTRGGPVETRLLGVEREYTAGELERISAYCTRSFHGLVMPEIRARLLALMVEERARYDELVAGAVELGNRAMESETQSRDELFLEGAARVVERASPPQLEAIRSLFATLADKALLLSLLNKFLAAPSPSVLVGSELTPGAGCELGLIVTSFQTSAGERGLIGVIGPKRMNYPYIIPVVDYLGHYLGELGAHPDGT